jgi:hypothetical protein
MLKRKIRKAEIAEPIITAEFPTIKDLNKSLMYWYYGWRVGTLVSFLTKTKVRIRPFAAIGSTELPRCKIIKIEDTKPL